jgi:type III pantothenate kinase
MVAGVYSGDRMVASWRLHTDRQRMADEYGVMIRSLLRDEGFAQSDIEAVAISNVVPALRNVLDELCTRHLKAPVLRVGAHLDLGLELRIDHPNELGQDLIAAAVAAKARWQPPLLVIDFGTATTISAIDHAGDFVGAIIAPGFIISTEAIYQRAPHLPRIPFTVPDRIVGTNTLHAMQSGLLVGHACLVDGLVGRMQAEVKGSATVVATGGLAETVARACQSIQFIEPWLVLEGIRLVYERNRVKAERRG